MNRRPTAAELVAAVADFLDDEVRAAGGALGFHARVAGNVLRIVERELNDVDPGSVAGTLQSLGCASEDELSRAIRAGRLDDRPDGVIDCLTALVLRKLAVDHPGYDSAD